MGMGAVEIRQPRVRDLPEGAEPFRSEIVGRWSGVPGPRAGCSPASTSRGWPAATSSRCSGPWSAKPRGCRPTPSCGRSEDKYRLWRCRPLGERYVYVFADGLYLKAGQEREKTAVLVVIGVRADVRSSANPTTQFG